MRPKSAAKLLSLLLAIVAALAAQTGKPAPPVPAGDPGWPREYASGGDKLILYQPQVDEWKDERKLEARTAAAVQPAGAEKPFFGAVQFTADTKLNAIDRTVYIFNLKITNTRFPSPEEARSQSLAELAGKLFPKDPVTISLDRLLAYVEQGQVKVREIEVSLEPPPIFVSEQPAVLLMIDGEPLLADIEGTGLQYVVNTNWSLFFEKSSAQYYLLMEDFWVTALDLNGPWTPAESLPAGFASLPDDPNWDDVRQKLNLPPAQPGQAPRVFLSYRPAELIVIDGEPKFEPIPGTRLMVVSNTGADLFFHQGDRYFYFLTSGRWFRTASPAGPWEAATLDLPEDFARIPVDHPRARVRASVPGTPEAEDAVLMATIPRTATLDRKAAKAETAYAGEPEFKPIEDTGLAYAVNTQQDVIRYGDSYYLCEQGVWFVSRDPNGPWALADSVPEEIHRIPPQSEKHHVTYVYVYDSDEETVTTGHTGGYGGIFLSFGLAMWGTGYYHSPYYYWGPHPYPIYYPPRYYTYGVRAGYNPATGTYYRGAAVYGPWGGYGRSAVYNPRTGAYYRGGAAWGPYGAGWRGYGYNPDTDTFRRGGAVVDYWNDAYAAGYVNTSPYGRWGEAVVGQGDDWVHLAGGRNEDRAVLGFENSEGAKGVIGRNEDSRGVLAKDEDNNVYVGKDGELYKRNDDGDWQKHTGDGDWEDVPAETVEAAKQERRAQAEERAANLSPEQKAALEQRARDLSPEQQAALQERAKNLSPEQRAAVQERAAGRAGEASAAGAPAQSPAARLQGQGRTASAGQSGAAAQARPQPGTARTRPRPGTARQPGTPAVTSPAGVPSGRQDVMRSLERDARARSQGAQRTRQYRQWNNRQPSRSYSRSGGRSYRGGFRRRR